MALSRIGYVLRYWPTRSETFVAREVEGLRARGLSIDVVSLGRRSDAPEPDATALAVPRGPDRRWSAIATLGPLGIARGLRRWSRSHTPKELARVGWLAAVARDRGWERIVAHFAGEGAELSVAAAALAGIPCAVTVHGADLFRPRPRLPDVLRAATPLITVCEHHRAFLRAHYGVDAHVVPSGVPLDVPLARPGEDVSPTWVCVARDVPKKGLDLLVAAFREVGVGRLRLVSDAVRLGGPGVLAGPLRPDEVPAALARAHAFVLPCVVAPDGDRDGLPVAALEAMAAGLPVLTTDVAGLPERFDDRTGWRVRAGDRASLVAAMREAARHPSERARRGAAARTAIERSGSLDQQLDHLLALWGGRGGDCAR